MKKKKIIKTLALALGILSLPVTCNIEWINSGLGMIQEAKAIDSTGLISIQPDTSIESEINTVTSSMTLIDRDGNLNSSSMTLGATNSSTAYKGVTSTLRCSGSTATTLGKRQLGAESEVQYGFWYYNRSSIARRCGVINLVLDGVPYTLATVNGGGDKYTHRIIDVGRTYESDKIVYTEYVGDMELDGSGFTDIDSDYTTHFKEIRVMDLSGKLVSSTFNKYAEKAKYIYLISDGSLIGYNSEKSKLESYGNMHKVNWSVSTGMSSVIAGYGTSTNNYILIGKDSSGKLIAKTYDSSGSVVSEVRDTTIQPTGQILIYKDEDGNDVYSIESSSQYSCIIDSNGEVVSKVELQNNPGKFAYISSSNSMRINRESYNDLYPFKELPTGYSLIKLNDEKQFKGAGRITPPILTSSNGTSTVSPYNTDSVTVSITNEQANTSYYYTLDGSTPTVADSKYTDRIEIDSETLFNNAGGSIKVSVIGIPDIDGIDSSTVTTRTVKVSDLLQTTLPSIEFNKTEAENREGDIYLQITNYDRECDYYYTLDGSEPSTDSNKLDTDKLVIEAPDTNDSVSVTAKVIAVKDKYKKSNVASATVVFKESTIIKLGSPIINVSKSNPKNRENISIRIN